MRKHVRKMKILVKKEVEVNKTDIHWTYGNT
jgi:hypothetical protein